MREGRVVLGIEVDVAANTLCLLIGDDAVPATSKQETATIDVGTGGRLVGVELPGSWIDVMEAEPSTEHLTRSVRAEVTVAREQGSGALATVTIPRRGAGYEITWPSGNQ